MLTLWNVSREEQIGLTSSRDSLDVCGDSLDVWGGRTMRDQMRTESKT